MRHGKDTVKIGRTSAHRDSMFVNMLKSLIEHGRISTTMVKAKELRRRADHLITIAKKEDGLSARRLATAELRIRYNKLTARQAAAVKAGDKSSYTRDRTVIGTLFDDLKTRFANRDGGYTRIIRTIDRVGDSAPLCFIEFLEA
jgi:large subunit ribosomal protein L17